MGSSVSELERYKYSLVRCEHPDIDSTNLQVSSLEDCCKVALDFECEVHLISLSKSQIQGGYERFDLSRFDYYGVARTGKTTTLRIVVKVLSKGLG